MRKKSVLLFLIAFHVCLLNVANAQLIRFAPLPMVVEGEIEKNFQPFRYYLSTITGAEVEMVHFQSYRNLLDGLIDDQIDLAFLGPLPYVILTQQDPSYVPVVRFNNRDGCATYTCSLVSFDSNESRLSGNVSPLIALTESMSTCGYLATEQLLRRYHASLDDLPYYYTGKHSECALDVLRDNAQFAGMKTSLAYQYQNLGLRIVATSDPFPGFLLLANPRTLDAETICKIRTSLLALKPYNFSGDDTVTANWGEMIRYGAISVQSSDYDVIREMLDMSTLPQGDL